MGNQDLETIDIWSDIGSAAGDIYRAFAGSQKPFHLMDAISKTGRDEMLVKMALGWLSREGKVSISKDVRGLFQFRING